MNENKHLKHYCEKNNCQTIVNKLDISMKSKETLNLIYPLNTPHLFVHVIKNNIDTKYKIIQPQMDDLTKEKYILLNDKITETLLDDADTFNENIEEELIKILDGLITFEEETNILKKYINKKVFLTKKQHDEIKYYLIRNRLGFGKLEPLLNDPYIEDIHCTGIGEIKIVHSIFGNIMTDLKFNDDYELNKFILQLSERIGQPVSESNPIVDSVLEDGSRINFIYSREISKEGSSFTIRKFPSTPMSITQLTSFNTMSAQMAAYIWICLENNMNVFICGETASGKTTTLNASAIFIKPEQKIYTVENTSEVKLPHKTWQHLVTRETGKKTDVKMFDLLIAALRSRPDYIIIGEIRGDEGNVAFQAMQTGIPVISTFHAHSLQSMIQRLKGEPINVPITFLDNLNIVIIQRAVSINNNFQRRITSINEIEKYYDKENKILTRQVFNWDEKEDEHNFRGYFNSYILESKIAPKLGLKNKKEIYDELEKRTKIIQFLQDKKMFNYYDVWEIISNFKNNEHIFKEVLNCPQ